MRYFMLKKLTEVENNIVAFICLEKTDRQIAEKLNFSEDGIQRKIKKIKKFYGVKSRVGIVREAVKQKFSEELM